MNQLVSSLLRCQPPSGYGEQRRWLAQLQLAFSRSGARTRLSQMDFFGPLRVQRPFYPEGDYCHLYLLHPPGGLVSGDRLSLQLQWQPGAQALLTTPSAGKIYKADSAGGEQHQHILLRLEQAEGEWLPQETIIFPGANGVMTTRIELQGACKFIGWELISLGRPANQESFSRGRLSQRLELWQDGRPLLLEHLQLDARNLAAMQRNQAGLGQQPLLGTLLATGFAERPSELIELLRAELASDCCALSYRRGVLLLRYRGGCAEQARQQFIQAWQHIRPLLLGRAPCAPRIWST
ncbi:urease accessory protein UreD [Balneatrix alpica]|uniref:Urease accessory protein UreD n=1 Tax=Balneatrix alpica TaxID=75684 RepID=A0ABV5ZBR9_9GAMM|nr:urease accessory protein UreD [Balneatrix alpica]